MLDSGCDWGVKKDLFYPQRRHSVRSHVINVVVSIVQVCTGSMWWKRIQSIPKRKSMIYFVISKASVIQNVVKTTYRPHTHQHIMNKKAEREKNHLVLNLGCDWWGNNYLFYHQRRHSVRSHVINVVVSIVQVCTGSTWWKRTQSIPITQDDVLFCHIQDFCHSKRSQNNI